jgi:hypothetical protein
MYSKKIAASKLPAPERAFVPGSQCGVVLLLLIRSQKSQQIAQWMSLLFEHPTSPCGSVEKVSASSALLGELVLGSCGSALVPGELKTCKCFPTSSVA